MEGWFNEGSLDRVVRLTVGVFLLGVSLIFLAGPLKVIVGILAGIALLTAVVGICPIYIAFNIKTK
jgi:hypothetical protein